MPTRATVKIRLIFRDRGRNEASTHLYLPFSSTVDDVFDFVNAAIPRYNAVSNALIAKVVAEYEFYYTNLSEPSPQSDNTKVLLIFYRNEQGLVERISIPSPKSDLFETSGDYAGIRIDTESSGILYWEEMTLNGYVELLTKDGIVIGPEVLTGGIAI
jgi:hypothetical protein